MKMARVGIARVRSEIVAGVVNAEQSCCFAIASSSNQKIPANNPAFPENAAPSQRDPPHATLRRACFVAAEYAVYMVPKARKCLPKRRSRGVFWALKP